MSDEIGKHAKLKPLCLNDLGVQVSPHPPKNFLKDLHLGCKMFYNLYRKERKEEGKATPPPLRNCHML